MAINLSKNKTKNLVYSTREKKRMNFLLFMSIFMIVTTTALMIMSFYVLPACTTNLILITTMCLLGYLGAFCYYDAYQTTKKGGDHE
jgi:hypothetical protein